MNPRRHWPKWLPQLLWTLLAAALLASLLEWNGRRRETQRIETTRRLLELHGIRIEPTREPLIVRELHFYPALLPATRDLLPWLHANGIAFYEGCYADYDPDTGWLHFRNTQAQQDLVETIVTDNFQFTRWERAIWWVKSWLPGATPPPYWGPNLPAATPESVQH